MNSFKIITFVCFFFFALHAETNEIKGIYFKHRKIIEKYNNAGCSKIIFPSTHSLDTNKKVIALTFDACGGPGGGGYDAELINYLIKNNVKATLFISGLWIKKNKEQFLFLSKQKNFLIGNHGYDHKIAGLCSFYRYGVKSTSSTAELIQEVELNSHFIKGLTGAKPVYYRSATGYYDLNAFNAILEMGYVVVNGDTAAFDYEKQVSAEMIYLNMKKAKSGSIIAAHMNHPECNTYEAVKLFVPDMKKLGYKFILINEYPIKTGRGL